MNAKLTKEQAYELGYKHGAEMARESGSADPGVDGWDGMLINADVRFCVESFGDDFRNSAELAEYVRGAQSGASEQVKSTTPPDAEPAATDFPFLVVFIPHQRPQFVRTFESEQNLVDRWVNGEFSRSCSAGPSEDYREEETWTFANAIDDLGHDLSNLLIIRDAAEYEAEMNLDRVRGVRKELIEAAVELGWVAPKHVISLYISATMTSDQRRRWNAGNLLDDDLDSIKIHYRDSTYTVRDLMPVEDGGRDMNYDLWKLIEDERADQV